MVPFFLLGLGGSKAAYIYYDHNSFAHQQILYKLTYMYKEMSKNLLELQR